MVELLTTRSELDVLTQTTNKLDKTTKTTRVDAVALQHLIIDHCRLTRAVEHKEPA